MSCSFQEDLTAHLDNELPKARREALTGHLPGCGDCRRTLSVLHSAMARLSDLPASPELSPRARAAVLSRLERPPSPSWGQRLGAVFRPALLVPFAGLAVAAVAVLLVAGPGGVPEWSGNELLLAEELELVESMDVLGLESTDDLEVVLQLHEVEVTP